MVNIENSTEEENIHDISIGVQKRSSSIQSNQNYIEVSSRRRVGNNRTERAGMTETEVLKALKRYGKNDITVDIPGRFLRLERTRPLLMLHVIDAYKNIEDSSTLLEKRLFAYGISFPTSNVKIEPVEFAVNTIYAINNYEGFEDDEE